MHTYFILSFCKLCFIISTRVPLVVFYSSFVQIQNLELPMIFMKSWENNEALFYFHLMLSLIHEESRPVVLQTCIG